MKKNFNSVQILETSEVCNKFSKSVSYETLVGGTATTGRECVQNQWLSKGSADKPLTAVGTLTSLLCNSAKVMEKLLHRHSEPKAKNPKKTGTVILDLIGHLSRIKKEAAEVAFGAASQAPCLGSRLLSCPRMTMFWSLRFAGTQLRMTFSIPALVLIFTLATTTESRAECYAKENYSSVQNCYDTWNPGNPNNCGDGCTYDYNNGKLTVTATKPDAVIPEGIFSPTYYEEKAGFPNITNIEIAGEFKTIGRHAFLGNNSVISGKGGVLYTNNISNNAFGNNNTLTGTIIVNDKQSSLNQGPWYLTYLHATVILPSTLRSISGWFLFGLNLGENAKIYCGVENCEELFSNVDCDAIGEQYSTRCKNNLNTLLSSGKLLPYPDGCTKMGATGCTKCKNENFKLNDGECDRLRWTPAEAAKVLKDDNTNEVTITFKK